MSKTTTVLALLALSMSSLGCAFKARSPQQYRTDTRSLVQANSDAIVACYDKTLAKDPKASGTVTVGFVVQKKTGAIANAWVDEHQSTAPKPLSACVVDSLEGLKLTPQDRRDGRGIFTWDFSAKRPSVKYGNG